MDGRTYSTCPANVELLLSKGYANCWAFAFLFQNTLAVNGIPSTLAVMTVDPTKTDATGFLVKNWTAQVQGYYYSPTAVDDFIYRFQSSTPSPYPEMVPDQSQYGDLVRLTGIPGQGNADPAEKIFGNHGIVQYGSTTPTFYDPSYGVTYSVSSFGADFEQGLSGYFMTSPLDDLGDFRVSLGPPIGLGAIRFQYVR